MRNPVGGRCSPYRPGVLRKAFEAVAQDLRHQYAVAYTSENEIHDGRWREIRLVPRRDDLEVVTRAGYFARSDGG